MNSGIDEAFLSEIASHSHTSVDRVREKYQSILFDLHAKARIHDFIPLLAMNTVRQYFHDLNQHPSLNFSVAELRKQRVLRDIKFLVPKHAH